MQHADLNGSPRQSDATTKLIASSVVRGAEQGQSHGGLCVVDFATQRIDYVIDWNTTDIDVAGRGGDRGLRGVAPVGNQVYVLSNKALLLFDRDFNLRRTFTNRYLKHCHELSAYGGCAYIVSTGYDAIVAFDVALERFAIGYQLVLVDERLRLLAFDPESAGGPAECNSFHLNSVKCDATGLYFSGLRTAGLLRMAENKLMRAAELPRGTHNAQPFGDGIIYNDTANDRLCVQRTGREMAIPLSIDSNAALDWTHVNNDAVARPLFARGLCVLSERYVAGGSSPSTITMYDLETGSSVAQLSLSKDVRNAIHGLAAWPADSAFPRPET